MVDVIGQDIYYGAIVNGFYSGFSILLKSDKYQYFGQFDEGKLIKGKVRDSNGNFEEKEWWWLKTYLKMNSEKPLKLWII